MRTVLIVFSVFSAVAVSSVTARPFQRHAMVPLDLLTWRRDAGETFVKVTPSSGSHDTSRQTPPAAQKLPSCDRPEHRQFDFWVGEWDVTVSGKPAGTNSITKEMKGCVIHEHWSGGGGLRGESFNIWDRTRKKWHQTWVTDTGNLLVLEGEFVNGAMQMTGESMTAKGAVTNRVTWTPNPDGSVRQFWESSTDGGNTWQTSFDGLYRRAKK